MLVDTSNGTDLTATKQKAASRIVLVVDDEYSVVELLQDLLESAGYQVLTAMSGEEAVKIYAQRHPNAVLLDVRLPDKSGVQALDEIRHMDPQGRVAIVTALGRCEVVRQAIEAGASDYILKPLDMDRVLQVVEDLCA